MRKVQEAKASLFPIVPTEVGIDIELSEVQDSKAPLLTLDIEEGMNIELRDEQN